MLMCVHKIVIFRKHMYNDVKLFPKVDSNLCGYQSSALILRFTNFLEKYYFHCDPDLHFHDHNVMGISSYDNWLFQQMSSYIYCSFFLGCCAITDL